MSDTLLMILAAVVILAAVITVTFIFGGYGFMLAVILVTGFVCSDPAAKTE